MESAQRDLAHFYESWGHAVFIAVALRDKKPLRPRWQDVTFEQSLEPDYQDTLRFGNLGVLHGPPSANLVAVDCDSEESVKLWLEANPWSAATRQARGKNGRRFYFRIKGDYPARRIPFGSALGEWHGGHTQTVIDGIHPDGPPFVVLNPRSPILEVPFERFAWPGRFKRPEIAQVEETEEIFHLSGRRLPDFLDLEIPADTNLIGNRWLTRDGSLFIVAPSGHGKSSFAIALMIHFAIGRIAFGLKPAQPLRILLLEAEDDDADNKSFIQVARTMNLTEREWSLLADNTRVEFRRDLTGDRFFKALDAFLFQWPPDIIIINPLSGFYTQSLNDDEAIAEFLRNRLNALMVKHACAPIIIAHMPKNQVSQLAEKQWYEWMYVLSGCATLTNWARAILVFSPTKIRGTYRFISAKRHAKTGWTEPEFYFSHHTRSIELNGEDFEIISWVQSSQAQIQNAKPDQKEHKRKREYTKAEVYQKMSLLDSYSRDQFRSWCKETFDMGINTSDRIRSTLVDDGLISVIETPGVGAIKSRLFKKNQSHP